MTRALVKGHLMDSAGAQLHHEQLSPMEPRQKQTAQTSAPKPDRVRGQGCVRGKPIKGLRRGSDSTTEAVRWP